MVLWTKKSTHESVKEAGYWGGSLTVLDQHNIHLSTKLKVYNVHPFLLYGCKTWTVYCRHIKKMKKFHIPVFHFILGIMLRITSLNFKSLACVNLTSIESMLINAQI